MLPRNTHQTRIRPQQRQRRRATDIPSLAAALSLLWAATMPAAPLTSPIGLQAASHPENGDTYFLFQGVPYLQLGLQAENASPAQLQAGPSSLAVTLQRAEDQNETASLSLRKETSSSFHIEAQSQSANTDSPAYLTFELGQDFRGGRLRALSHHQAKATVYPFPAPSGQIMAKTFELIDSQERVIQISLDQERPAEISEGARLKLPLHGQPPHHPRPRPLRPQDGQDSPRRPQRHLPHRHRARPDALLPYRLLAPFVPARHMHPRPRAPYSHHPLTSTQRGADPPPAM